MGWADMLIKLGLPYDSEEAIKLGRRLMKFIQKTAWETSAALGKEKGSFPTFKGSLWEKRGYKHFRNATTTTIAPTGSLSMVAGCSGGIEPHFALAFYRKAMGEYELPEVNQDLVIALKRHNGTYSQALMNQIAKQGAIQNLNDIPDHLKRIFVTSMDIPAEAHVRMQAAFQENTDNAVSKTINLPSNATVEDVEEALILSWKLKCKGVTVYRDQSREVQVLNVGERDGKKLPTSKSHSHASAKVTQPVKKSPSYPTLESTSAGNTETCPNCNGPLMMQEGCATCPACAYSHCSL